MSGSPAPTVTTQRQGRVVTIDVTDPGLIGATPTTMNQTRVSYRTRPLDYVPAFAFATQ